MKSTHQNIISIVFILFTLLQIQLPAQNKNIKQTNWPEPVFEHLTIADGLPENTVRCILQDHLGYMWFGTQSGLVRYDGYNMKVFQPDLKDSLSISDRQIMTIYEDRSGTVWIGTQGGFNRFDRTTETFKSYLHSPEDSTSINSNYVLTIYEDKTGNLLVGTLEGLNLFNRQTKKFKHIYYQGSVYSSDVSAIIEDSLAGKFYVAVNYMMMIYDPDKKNLKTIDITEPHSKLGTINSFYQAKDGSVWIGHNKGLARFNSLNNTLENYQPFSSMNYKVENDIGKSIKDDNGFIWTHGDGTNNSGLVCFDPKSGHFRIYKSDPVNQTSLSTSNIAFVYIDNSGVLWVGTGWGGLNKWDRNRHKFKRFSSDAHNSNSEPFNIVYTIIEDREGTIWFGTENGLNSFNRFSNEFRNYKYTTKDESKGVNYIYKDESGTIWFGTTAKGLGKFNPSNGSFQFYSNNPNDSKTISQNNVRFILPEDNDNLWVGTWGGGLNKFNKSTENFSHFVHDQNDSLSLSSNQITSIYKDRQGILWIGTNGGELNKFDKNNNKFKSFDLEGFGTGTILAINEDHKGNFWIGTYHTGIYLFDRVKEIPVYNITEKDGLANNLVQSILNDNSGNLWIGTENGLSKFDPVTNNIKSYFSSKNFDENRYRRNSAVKTSTGEMLFGTSDGFIMFHPDSIKDDQVPPQVVISDVSLFNRPNEKLKFNGFISELEELDLSYNENDLRFDYVGLHYGDPSKNQYKYMLEGFDKDWIDAGTQRNASYTNLDAGEYIFRVTACNADGVWNEEGASLKIIIPPPFWATWWAYSFYLIIFGSVLYGIRRYEMNRLNWKNQSKLDEVKLKEREETDRIKSRFFANISHEFRTPLTLIKGPAEKINKDLSGEEIEKQTNVIKRNADRLLALINQLLDLSKLEAGKLELKASKNNIVPFIKGITMSFESVAERKDITLKVKSSNNEMELYFDKEKMTKIMTNLLSNAFKFTPEGGTITVSLTLILSPLGRWTSNGQGEGELQIKVKDTGIGISEEELPKLFDRFYQVDSSQTREHEGTGIGLALTKELVELHHGTISAASKLGSGTEFTIELPIGRSHLKDEEIVEGDIILSEAKNLNENNAADSSHFDKLSVTNNAGEDKNIVLVVEDNADVREFIKDSLGNEFQIEEASNGEQGVRKAEQIIPDLIISDVMMPKMDGNELTRTLKNDEKTSHIPIILLTAKSEQESKLEGLEKGADAYLTKPFDTRELQIRINNLINIRRKLQEKFSSVNYVPVKNKKENEKKLTNLEERFMSKVMEVIENHLSEEEFSIEQFGKEVGMSRVQLHRKLKALSGKSASSYLRSVRLSKAKQMIEEQKGNISEIAYSVGFSSPQYFTRCFKEEFGFTPSDLSI